jgi:hypothetical protein
MEQVYTIEVKTTFMQYLIQKRYSQFLTLRDQVSFHQKYTYIEAAKHI